MRCLPFVLVVALAACGESASEHDAPATRCDDDTTVTPDVPDTTVAPDTADTAVAPDTADTAVAPDVAPDVQTEVTTDAVTTDAPTDVTLPEAPACVVCTPGEERCDGRRVVACAEVALAEGAPACLMWTVAARCNRFATCVSPDEGCAEPTVDPAGFDIPVADASEGIAVEDLRWDGNEGILTFSTARQSSRVFGVARFDADGPIGAARLLALDAQEAALAQGGGRTFVHWRDFGGIGSLAEILVPELLLGPHVPATAKDIAQNLHAFAAGAGVVVYQTSVAGGQSAWLGWYAPDADAVVWLDATPRFDWNRTTAAVLAGPDAGFRAAWFDEAGTGLASARFDGTAARVGAVATTTPARGLTSPAMLGLVPDGDGALVVWTALVPGAPGGPERGEIFVAPLDAAGQLGAVHATERADTDFGAFVTLAGWDETGLWLAFPPTTAFDALVLARLGRDATLTADRVINTVGGGHARVAGGRVANCWGIAYSGLRCAITPATP